MKPKTSGDWRKACEGFMGKWDLTVDRPLEKKFAMPRNFESSTGESGHHHVGAVDLNSGVARYGEESPVRCLLSDLAGRLPAWLLKVSPADEFSEEEKTLDLEAIGRLSGVDNADLQLLTWLLSERKERSYRSMLKAQPDDKSKRAFDATYRKMRRMGEEEWVKEARKKLSFSLARYLVDGPGESALDRARRVLYGNEEPTKPGPAVKMFFAVKVEVKAPPPAKMFAERYPREAAAAGLEHQCPRCHYLATSGADLARHICLQKELAKKYGWRCKKC